MNSFQSQYILPITILELEDDKKKPITTTLEIEGDKKFIFINHPVHGQHRFSLPTKEEISKDYPPKSKKRSINSFMIFRTYLQKSKQKQDYLILGEVSKIASDAWSSATQEVIDACGELETKLKNNFKYERFVPYLSHNPKKSKKTKPPSKKELSSPYTLTPSRDHVYYPSPPMITTSMITTPMISTPMTPDLMYSDLPPTYPFTPLATPMCIFENSQMNVPLVTLPPLLTLEDMTSIFPDSSDQSQLSSLTPSQIFSDFDPHFLGSGYNSSVPQFDHFTTESEVVLTEAQSTWNLEPLSISPEDGQNELCEHQ
jgi:hypothetical protein